jgi:hypothetical protein
VPDAGPGPGAEALAAEAPEEALAQLLARLPHHCINERAYIEVMAHRLLMGW